MKKTLKLILLVYTKFMTVYFTLLASIVGFETVAMRISGIPYRTGNQIRYNFYKQHLKALGRNVTFNFGTLVTNKNTTIGDNVRFGPFNSIGYANIGSDILTAQNVHILSGSNQHSYSTREVPIIQQPGTIGCIELAGDNWIGASVVIMHNVGLGTIIGSGSIVTTPISDMVVAAGNPCKVLKSRP